MTSLEHPTRRPPTPLHPPGARSRWWAGDNGQITAFVVVLMVGLLALAGLTLDGGHALAATVTATDQAQSAARAGAQAIDLAAVRATGTLHLMPTRAAAQAHTYLTQIGATGTVTVSGDTVTVTITATTRTQLLGMVGISSLTVHGTGSATPQRGIMAVSLHVVKSEVDDHGNADSGGPQ